MAAPGFVSASTGATDAGGAWSFSVTATGINNGDVIILQILQDGTTDGAVALTSVSDRLANLAGTANALTAIPGPNGDGSWPVGSAEAARQFLWIGRLVSGLTLTVGGTNSTSEDLYARAYWFTSASTGSSLTTVIENGTAGNANNGAATSTTCSDTAVTTLGPDRLALNLLAINDDNPFAGFTGQSGGTWTTEASYAEASGTDGAIYLIDAAMATAGTIDGGTGSITDIDAWGVVGFALIGTTPDVVVYVPKESAVNYQDPGVL